MTTKHTPGPWEVNHTGTGIGVDPVCDAVNATFRHDNELMRIEAEANANLIAAAPDLLEACIQMVFIASAGEVPRNLILKDAKAAIAKAEAE